MTRHPSVKAVTFETLISQYGATFFRDALTRFVVIRNQPTLTPAQVELASGSVYFNFRAVPVYHKIKFTIEDILGLGTSRASIEDVAHVRPARKGKYDIDVAARHDTVLVRAPNDDGRDVICGEQSALGVLSQCQLNPRGKGFRVAQVRVVFQLPEKAKKQLFPLIDPGSRPRHLAYVEWFAPFGAAANPHPDHGLYRVARSVRQGARLASVIAVDEIERSCHLFPEFGSVAARQWTSASVLEECPSFFLNTFVDRYTYMLVHQ